MPRKTPPIQVPSGHKYCFRCESAKPLDAFATDRSKPDGRCPACRVCDNRRRMALYDKGASERGAAKEELRKQRLAAAAAKREAYWAARKAAYDAHRVASGALYEAGLLTDPIS